MKREECVKVLNNPKAGKELLREALASALGVAYERNTGEKVITVFSACRESFMEAYKDYTGLNYSFSAKDGAALSGIIKKMSSLGTPPENTEMVFKVLVDNLPEWYRQNAYSLPVINNKFNEIVAAIKKNGRKQVITDDYKARILNDLSS